VGLAPTYNRAAKDQSVTSARQIRSSRDIRSSVWRGVVQERGGEESIGPFLGELA
jgi:hypothetical protein